MQVKKGARPHISPDAIPITACSANKVRIKIRPRMENVFRQGRHKKDKNGYIKTGNPTIDSACKRIRGKKCKQLINSLYQTSQGTRSFSNRHRDWEFHLWEEIELEPGTSIIEAVKYLTTISDIEIVEPVYTKKRTIFVPNDPWFYGGYQWALKNTGQFDIDDIDGQIGIPGWDINIEPAWAIEAGDSRVIVAVIDGGVQFSHIDLAANIWPGIGPQGINTIPDDHGTHVAGVISAVSNNSLGMASIAGGTGTNNGVKIMSLDLWGITALARNSYSFMRQIMGPQ